MWIARHFLSLVLFILFVSSQVLGGQSKSVAIWKQRVLEDPTNMLKQFNLGVALHEKKQFKAAAQQYMKVIHSGSELTPVCNYYMARIHEEVGHTRSAKRWLQKIDLAQLPKNLKKRVLAFKNKLYLMDEPVDAPEDSPRSTDRRYSIYTEFAGGVNNNPTFDSSQSSDRQLQFTGNAYYRFWISEVSEWKADYSLQQVWYKTNSGSNFGYHTLSLPYYHYFSEGRVLLTPDMTFDLYGSSLYSRTYSLAGDYTQKYGSIFVSATYKYSRVFVVDDTYSYLNGLIHAPRLTIKKNWDAAQLSSYFKYDINDLDDNSSIAASYTAPGGGLSYVHYLGSWDFALTGAIEFRSYNQAESDSFARFDTKVDLSLQPGYVFNDFIRIFVDFTLTRNISNFDSNSATYSYSQGAGLVGVSAGL